MQDASGNMSDSAVSSVVGALLSVFGLNHFGVLTTALSCVLYVVIFTALAMLASFVASLVVGFFVVTSMFWLKFIKISVPLVFSMILLMATTAAGSDEPTTAGTAQTANDTPQPTDTLAKASLPPNTADCTSGTAELFTSVAADLGAKGLGEAGAVDGTPYTSCQFARNVASVYLSSYKPGESGTVRTTSPKSPNLGVISMYCWPLGPNIVKCDGGTNAHVYIY